MGGCDLPTPVDELHQIPGGIVAVALGVAQRIGARGQPVHAVVGVGGGVAVRVRDRQQIAVAVIGVLSINIDVPFEFRAR
jgi:hypothetical protein